MEYELKIEEAIAKTRGSVGVVGIYFNKNRISERSCIKYLGATMDEKNNIEQGIDNRIIKIINLYKEKQKRNDEAQKSKSL